LSPGYAGTPVVVLGATGFIGRWVARKLCQAGARLHLIVRDAASLKHAHGVVIECDLARPDAKQFLTETFRRIRPAVVFNLAGYGVDPGDRDEQLFQALNTELPRAIMEAAAASKAPEWPGQNVVHAGSALEYGEARGNLAENGPANPTTLYGKTKLEGTLAVARSDAFGLRAVTARLFTVYGPGERSGRLLPSLIAAARSGAPLKLTAGTQQRDFTYVENVADGLLRLGAAPCVPGGVVNLATGRLTSVRRFAETGGRVLGIPEENLIFGAIPTRAEEMSHEPVSIELLRSVIGVVPETSIADGIRRTLEFQMQR